MNPVLAAAQGEKKKADPVTRGLIQTASATFHEAAQALKGSGGIASPQYYTSVSNSNTANNYAARSLTSGGTVTQ